MCWCDENEVSSSHIPEKMSSDDWKTYRMILTTYPKGSDEEAFVHMADEKRYEGAGILPYVQYDGKIWFVLRSNEGRLELIYDRVREQDETRFDTVKRVMREQVSRFKISDERLFELPAVTNGISTRPRYVYAVKVCPSEYRQLTAEGCFELVDLDTDKDMNGKSHKVEYYDRKFIHSFLEDLKKEIM